MDIELMLRATGFWENTFLVCNILMVASIAGAILLGIFRGLVPCLAFLLLLILSLIVAICCIERDKTLRNRMLETPEIKRLSAEYMECRKRMAEIEHEVYRLASRKNEAERIQMRRRQLQDELEKLGKAIGVSNDQAVQKTEE